MSNTNNNNVQAANASRFQASNYSEALTAYTVGWMDSENLEDMLEFIAPAVSVGRRFEFKKSDNAEAFLSETDDIRSSGSSFKRVEYTGETVIEKTLNKGLTIRVDHDDIATEDWQERYVEMLMKRLYRNELRRAMELISASSEEKEVAFKQDGTDCNPDAMIRSMLVESTDASGVRPNRVLFGESAWDLRSNAYSAQGNAGAFHSADLSKEGLANKLLVDDVEIAKARYQVGTGKESIVGKEIYAFYAQNGVTKDEPSNIKRFVTPVDGAQFRVYVEEHAKYTDITVEHYSSIVVTSPIGLNKLKVTA